MIINVKVKTCSGKQEFKKISDNDYKISLKSPPEDNKANIELLKMLKKYFGRQARIIKGARSRNKIVEIIDNK